MAKFGKVERTVKSLRLELRRPQPRNVAFDVYVPGVGGFRCADVVLVGTRAQRLPAPPKDIASCTVT